jgi:hypothetical protein
VLTGFRKDEGLAGLLDVYGFGAAYFVRSLAKLDWLGCLMWLIERVVPLLALELLVAAGALDDISRAAICRVTVPIEAMSSGLAARVAKFNRVAFVCRDLFTLLK